MRWVLLAFIVIPILEMIVLIEVGSILGSVTTVFLVFLTAIIGVAMLRWQGISTLTGFNHKLQAGELPAQELLSAVFLVVAGAFLLTPGFVTDTCGFLLLVPAVRKLLAQRIIEKGMLSMVQGFESTSFYTNFTQPGDVFDEASNGFGEASDGFGEASGEVYEARRREEGGENKVVLISSAPNSEENEEDQETRH